MTTIAALKEQLKEKGLAVSGTKAQLQERLDLTKNWLKFDSVYVLNCLEANPSNLIAGYDLDGTIITPIDKTSTFCNAVDDWEFRAGMKEQIKDYQKRGFIVLIFTNQGRKANRHITLGRLEAVAVQLGECAVLAATEYDEYRKPGIGMWNLAKELWNLEPDLESSFYVGDSGGFSGDHSDVDKGFAEAVGVRYVRPLGMESREKEAVQPSSNQEMVILVGAQASGKSRLATTTFKDYVHASKDLQGARHKKVITEALAAGKSVVVDNTNPTIKGRAEYIAMAHAVKVPVRIVVLDTALSVCKERNKAREKPVPSIAIAMFTKNYEAPTTEEAQVVHV